MCLSWQRKTILKKYKKENIKRFEFIVGELSSISVTRYDFGKKAQRPHLGAGYRSSKVKCSGI